MGKNPREDASRRCRYQRTKKIDQETGEEYIETTLEDIKEANELLKEVLLAKSDELTNASRNFLELIKSYLEKEKTKVYRKYGPRAYEFVGGEWKENEIHFSTRNLGDFTLLTDSVAPTIKVLAQENSRLRFLIKDQLSGIKDFEVTIDGKYINNAIKREYL